MNVILLDPHMRKNGGNVGLGYLSSVLLEKGHRVRVIGADKELDKINQTIKEMDADIIGFSIRSNDTKQISEIAARVKKKSKALLICGGAHITMNGYSFLEENPCFDLGVIGEGEETIVDIIDFIKGEIKIRDIKGIIGRDNRELFQTEKRIFIKDLDRLPYPAYNVFDIYSNGISEYGMITSRGCPYGCTYCNGPNVMGKRWRYRSADNIIEEFIQVKKSYGKKTKWVDIFDDNFTLDLKRAKELCRSLIDKKLDLQWRLPNGIRADKIDDELAALMMEAGCRIVHVGIESGCRDVFDSINKGETLEDIERGVKHLKKHGIKTDASFIIGLPNSNYWRDMKSIDFAKKLKLNITCFHIFFPFKHTKAYDMAYQQKGVRVLRTGNETAAEFWSGKPYSVFDTESYPEKERIKVFMKGNLRFHDYLFTRDFSKSPYAVERLFTLIKIIFQYDPVFIPVHIFRLIKKFITSVGRRFCEKGS